MDTLKLIGRTKLTSKSIHNEKLNTWFTVIESIPVITILAAAIRTVIGVNADRVLGARIPNEARFLTSALNACLCQRAIFVDSATR